MAHEQHLKQMCKSRLCFKIYFDPNQCGASRHLKQMSKSAVSVSRFVSSRIQCGAAQHLKQMCKDAVSASQILFRSESLWRSLASQADV